MNFCLIGRASDLGGSTIEDQSIKARLITAGKTLFAEHGFAGASVREICKAADASSTMIHHYFGNKEGLYNAILEEFSSATFDVPLRLIAKPAATKEEFRLRFEMFVSETFRALIDQAAVFRILVRDSQRYLGMTKFHDGLTTYLEAAQADGFVDAGLKVDLVTGLILDRLGGQIMFAAMAPNDVATVLNDATYAEEWLEANTQVLMFGFCGTDTT